MTEPSLSVSAPGRICLFGEHQDYFGLPVIAAAIDLRLRISGMPRTDDRFMIDLPDIHTQEVIPIKPTITYTKNRDYFRSTLNVLQREKLSVSHGWDCRVEGSIPINSGSASSSALVVAWTKFLLEAEKDNRAQDPIQIAELSYSSEVEEFHEPGGKMDHYTSSLGKILFLRFSQNVKAEKIDHPLHSFVLADSLERKKTLKTLGLIKQKVWEGVNRIQNKIPDFSLRSRLNRREEEEINQLPPENKRLLQATLLTRDLTCRGKELFEQQTLDHELLGHLLLKQQDILRNHLQVSTPKIDAMIETSLQAGALGAKINGSGEGGSILAYTPNDPQKVVSALEKLGTQSFLIHIDQGVIREPSLAHTPERRPS